MSAYLETGEKALEGCDFASAPLIHDVAEEGLERCFVALSRRGEIAVHAPLRIIIATYCNLYSLSIGRKFCVTGVSALDMGIGLPRTKKHDNDTPESRCRGHTPGSRHRNKTQHR